MKLEYEAINEKTLRNSQNTREALLFRTARPGVRVHRDPRPCGRRRCQRAPRSTCSHWMVNSKVARATTLRDGDSEGELEGDGGAAFRSGLGREDSNSVQVSLPAQSGPGTRKPITHWHPVTQYSPARPRPGPGLVQLSDCQGRQPPPSFKVARTGGPVPPRPVPNSNHHCHDVPGPVTRTRHQFKFYSVAGSDSGGRKACRESIQISGEAVSLSLCSGSPTRSERTHAGSRRRASDGNLTDIFISPQKKHRGYQADNWKPEPKMPGAALRLFSGPVKA